MPYRSVRVLREIVLEASLLGLAADRSFDYRQPVESRLSLQISENIYFLAF